MDFYYYYYAIVKKKKRKNAICVVFFSVFVSFCIWVNYTMDLLLPKGLNVKQYTWYTFNYV
jgi:hypothetical protein